MAKEKWGGPLAEFPRIVPGDSYPLVWETVSLVHFKVHVRPQTNYSVSRCRTCGKQPVDYKIVVTWATKPTLATDNMYIFCGACAEEALHRMIIQPTMNKYFELKAGEGEIKAKEIAEKSGGDTQS